MLWGVNIFSLNPSGLGAQIYDAIIDIGVILIIAYFVWEIARAAIDQRMAEESPHHDEGEGEGAAMGDEGGHAAASRLSTLLPLVRTTFMIVLALVVFFVVLSELGVNVGPLIAGAGVIGIAIGFGAQTLVTDVISGIFFLIDDAFRRGEYIDVGVAKGTVEKISLRSLQLRHHNGPINTVPFGQIATVTNFSRDWAIIKLEIRVPFETDVNRVRKLVKKIGQEMMAVPELADMMLEPLKSQGVVRVDDSALIMRCKFTAKARPAVPDPPRGLHPDPEALRRGRHQLRPAPGHRRRPDPRARQRGDGGLGRRRPARSGRRQAARRPLKRGEAEEAMSAFDKRYREHQSTPFLSW